jgi:uncharacterized GH25 family protein
MTFNASDGRFEYPGLQAGTYEVHVRAPGFAATTVPDVVVGEGEDIDLGRIELRTGGVVYGTVVDEVSGLPIAGARVQITQGASRFVRRDPSAIGSQGAGSPVQITDTNGTFSFSGLKDGNLTLRVSHRDYVSQEYADVNPSIVNRSQGLVLGLNVGGEIVGTVLDPSGKPWANMPVYLIGDSAAANQTAKSDRQGRFQFRSVPPGAYTVKAHRFGVPGESGTVSAETTVQMTSGGTFDVVLAVK